MRIFETRRSVRNYKEKEVTKEQIDRLLEAARLAPSGNNTQPWRFIVVQGEEAKKQLVRINHDQDWMLSASVLIVCLADLESRISKSDEIWVDEYSDLPEVKLIIRDTAIAVEHLVLEAEDMGLATCWTAWYEQERIKEELHIPDNKYVVAVLTVGYADGTTKATPRYEVDNIVYYESWGNIE